MTSPDGITWTARTASASNFWYSVTYGAGLFVAVSDSGTISDKVMTSPDGVTWTSRSAAANLRWSSVTYGGGQFVALAYSGTGNRVMTSPDGITWTPRASAADVSWNSVAYGGGMFVAVAYSGTISNKVMTSGTFLAPPGAPPAPTAEAGDGQATITVTAGSGGTPAAYTVTASPGGLACTITVPATSCTIAGLANGTAYTFTATATNSTGASDTSPPTGAVTPSATASGAPTAPPSTAPRETTVPASAASIRTSMRASRRSVVSGQQLRIGVRARNTGGSTALQVTSCVRLPPNMALVRAPGAIRSGRTVCLRQGAITAGSEKTGILTVRAVAIRRVTRTLTSTTRATDVEPVAAVPLGIEIRPRVVRAPVTG